MTMKIVQSAETLQKVRFQNSALATALLTFFILRLWFSTLGIIGVTFRPMADVEPQNDHSYDVMQELDSSTFQRLFLSPWYRFDTVHYVEIAETGYIPNDHNSAFAPLFPALIRLVNLAIPSTMGSAMLVANAAAFLTIWLFLLLLTRYFTRTIATQSLLWFAIFPSVFILFQPYTESLFMVCMLACMLFIQCKS